MVVDNNLDGYLRLNLRYFDSRPIDAPHKLQAIKQHGSFDSLASL